MKISKQSIIDTTLPYEGLKEGDILARATSLSGHTISGLKQLSTSGTQEFYILETEAEDIPNL